MCACVCQERCDGQLWVCVGLASLLGVVVLVVCDIQKLWKGKCEGEVKRQSTQRSWVCVCVSLRGGSFHFDFKQWIHNTAG